MVLQDVVAKEEILNALSLEFVNRVNEVGVDVNRCVAHPHTATLVQFVCGLGPRKGYHLLKVRSRGPKCVRVLTEGFPDIETEQQSFGE